MEVVEVPCKLPVGLSAIAPYSCSNSMLFVDLNECPEFKFAMFMEAS